MVVTVVVWVRMLWRSVVAGVFVSVMRRNV